VLHKFTPKNDLRIHPEEALDGGSSKKKMALKIDFPHLSVDEIQ
jgi:hypothetical protein